jgi:8-oxo-dGTP diphosphatase
MHKVTVHAVSGYPIESLFQLTIPTLKAVFPLLFLTQIETSNMEVTCAIILSNDKILVTQRGEKMELPLKWEFSGGKIEENETAENCLIREIKEELNIEIEILERLESKYFSYEKFSINFIPFVAKYLAGEIILMEHQGFMWLTKDGLNYLDWASADVPVVDEFLKLNHDSARTI